jgi:uncharacterized membrane protein YoaK (UPF0700 family)
MGIARDYVAHPKHGPLPALLLVLTVVTGLVDAVSIIALGRVFVANMTGNVVFIAFAVAGAPGFVLSASLSALAGFLIGAAFGGVLAGRIRHRGRLLRDAAVVECALVVVALVTLLAGDQAGDLIRSTVAFLIAVAMGTQNAAARALAVPDVTTTVLTMTLTGIAADIRSAGWAVALRRSLAVVTMFAGAAIGAVLVLHVRPGAAIALAAALIGLVAVVAAVQSRKPAAWQDAA